MPVRQHPHAFEDRQRVRHVLVTEVVVERLEIQPPLEAWGCRRARSNPDSLVAGKSCSESDVADREVRGGEVPGVVEVHDFLEALEHAVVHVGLHKFGRWTHVHIAQSGYLELRGELRRELDPL